MPRLCSWWIKISKHASTRRNRQASKQNDGQTSVTHRPANDDKEAWKVYWKTQDQPWRTEPEINEKRKAHLTKRYAIQPDYERNIYPFRNIRLSRADVEWLITAQRDGLIRNNQSKPQPYLGLNLQAANISGIDLSNLELEGANLYNALLKESILDNAQLRGANLIGAQLNGASLNEVQLGGANLSEAQLKEAILTKAQLKEAFLVGAQLERANLSGANLEGTELNGAQLKRVLLIDAQLERANLTGALLEGATLSGAMLGKANLSEVKLEGASLSYVNFADNIERVGPQLADIQWNNVNLAVVKWSQIKLLGDEYQARQKKNNIGRKNKVIQLFELQRAVRANRQLAVALRSQGLNEEADRFAHRAQVLQRSVVWLQIGRWQWIERLKDWIQQSKGWKLFTALWQKLRQSEVWKQLKNLSQGIHTVWMRILIVLAFVFSVFLDVLAGYGYKPGRTFAWYLLVILGFATAYAIFGHLPLLPDALVFSFMSFHGRGFFPSLSSETNLHNPLVVFAAAEAVGGLFIEISFIATFTQKFFGK